jgi:hypothetical protein
MQVDHPRKSANQRGLDHRASLPQFHLRTLLVFVAIVAILMAVLLTVWSILSFDWLDDAYAQWGAGDMVVRYMEEHDGRWLRGWNDLRPYFDVGGGRVGGWSFEQYQQHIVIQWDVDPAVLEAMARANPRPAFRVISARWPAGTIGGNEPNEILHRYFRNKSSRPGDARADAQPESSWR